MSNPAQQSETVTYQVGAADLPVCCPRPQDEVWNQHPRVYLPVDKSGREVCPYCGIVFEFQADD